MQTSPGSRGLADEANLTANTAQSALHRLDAAKAVSIQTVPPEHRTVMASRLHLNKDWLAGQSDLPGGDPSGGWLPDLETPQAWLPVHSHIWDGHGLGVAALRVYCELTHGWMTITDLVDKTHISERAISRALRLLAEIGNEIGEPLIRAFSLSDRHHTWQAVPLADATATERVILEGVSFQGGFTITQHMEDRKMRHDQLRKRTEGARNWEAGRRQALAS